MDFFSLKGKTAIVTGGNSGLGQAFAVALATAGANLFVPALREEHTQTRKLIEQQGVELEFMLADITDGGMPQRIIAACCERFGTVDILVNNAGVFTLGSTEELALDDLDRMLAVNVRSVFVASQEAARHMNDGGRIIHIGSTNAERVPFGGAAVYAMSKSALVGLTKGMARDLGSRGITVNNVQPGPVDTEMNPDAGEFAAQLKQLMAIGRYGKDEEIAGFVAYLAGPQAGYITGASLSIDGGFSA